MGVKRAIEIAEEIPTDAESPVTILNEIVHNDAVVEKFRKQGVGQTSSVEGVASGTLVISAHGVCPSVKEEATAKGLNVVDATCPLVTRIYDIVARIVENGYHVIHFGDPTHDETHGVLGHAPENITVVATREELENLPDWPDRKLGMTVQTTAHMSEFAEVEKIAMKKWPKLEVFNTICNATTKRQTAVMDLAPHVDLFLIVGSKTSANSRRLAQISDAICGRGILIDTADDIDEGWINSKTINVGVSAGASTPQFLVEAVVNRLIAISGGTAEVIVPDKKSKIPRAASVS